MKTAPLGRRPLTVLAVAVSGLAAGAVASLWLRGRGIDAQYGLFVFHNAPPAMLLAWLGRMVLLRQPGNRLGAVLITIAALGAAHTVVAALADLALVRGGHTAPLTWDHPLVPADLPLSASVPLWVMNWLWVPQVVLLVTVLPLLFPDGRLPGPRWRGVLWLAAGGTALFLGATVIDGWPTSTWAVGESPAVVTALFAAGLLVLAVGTVLAFAGLAVHWRRATRARRTPFRVVGVAAGLMSLVSLATYPWQAVWIPTTLAASYVLLAAYALAVARFRVHDLEPVLAKSTVAAGLAVVATGVFVAVVLAVGLLAARVTDNEVLPLVAVGLVAVSAEPVRRGTRRLIDRLVFRLAADRSEVVSTIAANASEGPTNELLHGVVEALRGSTGASRVEAWLEVDGRDHLVGAAGTASPSGATLAEPMSYQGQRLGELRLLVDVAGDLAPEAADVLADVAHVAGAAIHNQQLSRRLVEAQDDARRSIERDLHDGAQAQLIALRLRLAVLQEHLRAPTASSPAVAREITALAEGIQAAVGSLRDLARGLHPPTLDRDGVAAALRAHVRTLPVAVSVRDCGLGRPPATVESALYFACLEAVQNALRHADAGTIAVELDATAGAARFTVTDDGRGFDAATADGSGLANMEDRVRAFGGRLTVDSTPGRGTRVTGVVPTSGTYFA